MTAPIAPSSHAHSSKTALITGASGFVGANLAHRLVQEGYAVHLLLRASSSLRRIASIIDRVTIHHADITDAKSVIAVVDAVKPSHIIHAAVYGGLPGQNDRDRIIATNLLGTVNLVDACSRHPYVCFINTGSSSEYGRKNDPMREDDLLEPNTDYAVFKAAATLYCQHVAREQGKPIVTLRLFSVYGMWEEEGRLIPTILSSYHEKTPPKLSSPSTVRDFVFIDDVCDAYLCIIKNAEIAAGKIYNVAGGKGVSIGEVVLCVQSLTGSRIEPVYGAVQGRAFDTNRWEGDTSLLRALGWAPRHELSEGLMKMISFKWGEPAITRMSDPKRQGGA